MDSSSSSIKHPTAWGLLYGTGAAVCWAVGFVGARHAVVVGLSPLVVALHRFVWAGLALLPFVASQGLGSLCGVGWRRGFALTVEQRDDLVAFLKSLTDEALLHDTRFADPWTTMSAVR